MTAPLGTRTLRTIHHHRSAGHASLWRAVRWGAGTVLLATVILVLWPAQWGGFVSFTVVSGTSMQPTYNSGDLVIGLRHDADLGDVIVYRPEDVEGYVVHRIVSGTPDGGWTTRGDANAWDDIWTANHDNILGVVTWRIPHVGGLVPTGPLLPIGIICLLGALLLWPARETTTVVTTESAETDDVPATTEEPAA